MQNPKAEIVRVMHFLRERRSHLILAAYESSPEYVKGYAHGLHEAIMALNQILNRGEAAIPPIRDKK